MVEGQGLTDPHLHLLSRILADRFLIGSHYSPTLGGPRTLSSIEADTGGFAALKVDPDTGFSRPRGGVTRIVISPVITEDGLPTVVGHELGHIITYRMKQLGGAIDLRKEDSIFEAVKDGTTSAEDGLTDMLMETAKLLRPFTPNSTANREVIENMVVISHILHPDEWEQRSVAMVYYSQPSELLADAVSLFMRYPQEVRDNAPALVAFIKNAVASDSVVSRLITFASLSGLALPGFLDLMQGIDPTAVQEGT